MPITLEQVELLTPLAIEWATEEEAYALKHGEPLNEDETFYAKEIGVLFPEKVRLLKVSAMPSPKNPILKKAADEMGSQGSQLSQADGLTLNYAIFIRQNHWRKLRLIVHELAHTAQYERSGGLSLLRQFILEYLDYPNGSLEREAISIEQKFFTNSLEERIVASFKKQGEIEAADSKKVRPLAEQIRIDFDKKADAARKRIKERGLHF